MVNILIKTIVLPKFEEELHFFLLPTPLQICTKNLISFQTYAWMNLNNRKIKEQDEKNDSKQADIFVSQDSINLAVKLGGDCTPGTKGLGLLPGV